MIIPNEEWDNAIKAGKKWLDDPKTEILYADSNGVVMRNQGRELSIRLEPHQISYREFA
jgi:hypothetical protein